MALQVYSSLFFTQHDLDGDGAAVGPPAGFIWVLRGVDCVFQGAAGAVFVANSAGAAIWSNSFLAAVGLKYASYRGRYVVEPTETLFASTSAPMDVSFWGYTLTLP